MSNPFNQFSKALRLLNGRLVVADTQIFNIVVCGGTALNATGMVQRTTNDVDIVALADDHGGLVDPAPLPPVLTLAANEVAEDLGLPENWLNNGPSSGDGGLFRLGLPEGFVDRLTWHNYGKKLNIAFIGRLDQIHFKLFAAVDLYGSYHASDLKALTPTDQELIAAIDWSRSHDPSAGYRESIRLFLKDFGYEHLNARL